MMGGRAHATKDVSPAPSSCPKCVRAGQPAPDISELLALVGRVGKLLASQLKAAPSRAKISLKLSIIP